MSRVWMTEGQGRWVGRSREGVSAPTGGGGGKEELESIKMSEEFTFLVSKRTSETWKGCFDGIGG